MTIVNQDYELINYDKFAKISMYEGEVDGTTIYAIVAFESVPDDIDSDNDRYETDPLSGLHQQL